MLLAIETATRVCSVCLKDGRGRLHEKRAEQRGAHSEKLFLFLQELMEEHAFGVSDLEAVLVSEGPGSYTGLRIAASAVKGLLFDTGCPLFAVNTLAGFARPAGVSASESAIHAVIDARRVHLYHQQFHFDGQGMLVADTPVAVRPIKEVEGSLRSGDTLVGTGLDRIGEEARARTVVRDYHAIGAGSLITLFEEEAREFVREVAVDQFDPNYHTSRQTEG